MVIDNVESVKALFLHISSYVLLICKNYIFSHYNCSGMFIIASSSISINYLVFAIFALSSLDVHIVLIDIVLCLS